MTIVALRSKFAERIAALPTKPGVYLMRNERDEVIYVGKAASLRSRVRSYFGSPRSMEGKTRVLVAAIADFEYVVTPTVQDALLLEATLVKRHQPFFNVRLKDDKHYPYLKVDIQNEWPRVYITRRVENDGARYFGPYASAGSVRTTLDVVNKLFPWRSCTKVITGTDPRPCLDYFIHRCIAPCTAYCTKEEYAEVIRQTILFLEGRAEEVLRGLRKQMAEASAAMDYEQAAILRDQTAAVEDVSERQMTATTRPDDADIFGLARQNERACVQVLFQRGTKIVGNDRFMLEGTEDEPDDAVLTSFLEQFYESPMTRVPRRIVVPSLPREADLLRDALASRRPPGRAFEILVLERGERKALVRMANDNAKEALEAERVKWLADTTKTSEALRQLQDELGLPEPPRRIECYDISNIQGTNSVASMVVFIDGRPASQQYRRFKIRTVAGANDFASMQEVLSRRFRRVAEAARPELVESGVTAGDAGDWADLPDLVIVDGGKGQLSAALDAMRDCGAEFIPTVGLAKKREELFIKDETEPIMLPRDSQSLYLVQRVRDEAHRFAIAYHRDLRSKSAIQSGLDAVPGVGPKRKKALLRKFGGVRAIREADVDAIASTPGMTRASAELVKEHL